MIKSFACKHTEELFQGQQSRKFGGISRQAGRKLLLLDAAICVNDLRNPPGNHLEALLGTRDGQYSIRINDQFRLCFQWLDGCAHHVEIVDYH